MKNLHEIITDSSILSKHYIFRDGFVFVPLTRPANVYDAIVIINSQSTVCSKPLLPKSKRSLDEHIQFINSHKIEKALVIAENLSFITKCVTLKYLSIIPADNVGNDFDFSPLYQMPEIKWLSCLTEYGNNSRMHSTIDYSNIRGLQDLSIMGRGHYNYNNINTLKSMGISLYHEKDLSSLFSSEKLDTLSMIQCKIQSLDGIEKSKKIQCLYLYYNRSLKDISALSKVGRTLKALRIENCPKIEDFSVLCKLENLELLELSGSNTLPNLEFLKNMKKLKTFTFSMNVLNGDLTPCLNLSYVYSEKNRKHYNLKDKNLPKNEYIRGNENIEEWRRLE